MKAKFKRFKAFIRKHIWADFLFVFITYSIIQIIGDQVFGNADRQIKELLFKSIWFTFFLTPLFRLLRHDNEGLGIYDLVDHVRHYQVGQSPKIKSYMQSKGYTVDYTKGGVIYYTSSDESIFSTKKTFIHETDHWIALVASPDILDQVPIDIISIYPR